MPTNIATVTIDFLCRLCQTKTPNTLFSYQSCQIRLSKKMSVGKQSTKIAAWDRKVSVPISMPQSLLADIDIARGERARSQFVCKILRAGVNVGSAGDAHAREATN